MAIGAKLGYGSVNNIDSALSTKKIDARDLVITNDTSEFIFIRDDLSKQVVRPRIQRFPNILSAINGLNASTDTYAGAVVMIMGDSGKYEPYIVQNGTDGFEVQPFGTQTIGLDWVRF